MWTEPRFARFFTRLASFLRLMLFDKRGVGLSDWVSEEAPAVLFRYSPDRRGDHPESHLQSFSGTLQADGYAGFDRLYESERIREAACWAHVRRKFYEIYESNRSPVAAEALARIGKLYEIEEAIRGRAAEERRTVRKARAKPELEAIKAWFEATQAQVSTKSALAIAIRYALTRWTALVRYRDDGHIDIDNNAAERALRAVALGRKNSHDRLSSHTAKRVLVIRRRCAGGKSLRCRERSGHREDMFSTVAQTLIRGLDTPW